MITLDMSEDERTAMEAVLAMAIRYVEVTEDATLFLEKRSGKLGKADEDALIEDYAQASYALVTAVKIYRSMNAKRIGKQHDTAAIPGVDRP